MQIESFSTTPLADVIKSYLYLQYSDDDDLQAFVSSFNSLSQSYLDWFRNSPLSVYTSDQIAGLLLDWIAQGIYGIERPVLTSSSTMKWGEINNVAFNTRSFNSQARITSGTAAQVTDDIYKRVLTWHTYLGDGRQASVSWLRRRVARFLFGTNGTDIAADYFRQVSISRAATGYAGAFNTAAFNTVPFNQLASQTTLAARSLTISVPASAAATAFKTLVAEGYLALPFQVTFNVIIHS
ncbi:hypothetical protein [Robbsia andropogonis]|uniref:hypothetical protein n=1 Tax=Robbsia andropogonis TaxID=28092 RepID=UPI002A6B231C|nr:hypothetical protein [Robbsia andropogonis]